MRSVVADVVLALGWACVPAAIVVWIIWGVGAAIAVAVAGLACCLASAVIA